MAYPLPETPTGPSWTARVTVPAIISVSALYTSEDVTLYFWREPCVGGTSAMLGRFQRDAQNEGRTDVIPVFPALHTSQGASQALPRLAAEPNTVVSGIFALLPLPVSVPFIFENYPTNTIPLIDYSESFDIEVIGVTTVSGTIPAYDATQY